MPVQALSAFNDNYIWLLPDASAAATGQAAVTVVDPGDPAPVFAAAAAGLRPGAILLTHHHQDHVGGVAELLQRWPGLPVLAPDDERIEHATLRVGDDARFSVGGHDFHTLSVPGHTRSHVAYHCAAGDGILFSGDTLFSLGCGRLFEGTPSQMFRSLQRLAALPGSTRLYCGHEYTLSNAAFARAVEPDNPALHRRTEEARSMRNASRPTLPSTLADELACNPFLRCAQPAVVAAVRRRLGAEVADPVEVFAELRRWKDGFRA